MGRSRSSSSSGSSSDSGGRDRRHRKDKKRKKEKHRRKKSKKEQKEKKRKRTRDDGDGREKEILAQAKKYLRQQGLAPSVACGIEAAAAAVSAASKSSTYGAIGNNSVGGVDEGTPSAAALAAKRVAEARASALEEDALHARMGGAPREGLLDFRTRGVDSIALGADGAGGVAKGENVGKKMTPAEAKRARRDAKERLEELAPRATGRDALREKRAAVRESNRSFAARKDEDFLGGMTRGDEFGGGGRDEFAAVLAARRRAQERRDARRGVDPAAVAARVGAYRAREAERMSQFQELVGGFGGERIHIPERR